MQCKSEKLFPFLDLGFHPHSDQFRLNRDTPEMTYPLELQLCEDCTLIQLTYMVDRAELFTKDYLYESSITKTALKHWEEMSSSIIKKLGITSGLVVDIGSNDGTLLQRFKNKGLSVLGVDPCKEVTDVAKKNGIPTHVDFWKKGIVKDADVILGTNVFCHIESYDDFMEAVKDSLKPDGVFVFESPYVMNFINELQYDTVYHQHVTYIGVKSCINFLEKVGMEIFDIEFTKIHGGSFRCYVAPKGQRVVQPIVQETIDKEHINKETMLDFAKKVKNHRAQLMSLLWGLKGEGKSIAAVSCPAKGMTLLNACGIDKGILDFATERSTLKQGRYTPGSHILIEDDKVLVERQPDYALLLAWNFYPEIIKNNPEFKGKWIIPTQNIQII